MVKTFLFARVFLPLLALVWGASLWAADYKEGIDYRVVPGEGVYQKGDRVLVEEAFWYGCPHCNDFEPILNTWSHEHRKSIHVVHLAVPSTSKRSPWYIHARLFFTLEALGLAQGTTATIFYLMHEEQKPLMKPERMYEALQERHFFKDLSKEDFIKLYQSDAVSQRVDSMSAYFKRMGVTSTPTLIVDKRIVILTQHVKSQQEMLDITAYVAQEVKAGRL